MDMLWGLLFALGAALLLLVNWRALSLQRQVDLLRALDRETNFRLDILRKEIDRRELTFEESVECDQWRADTAFLPGEELW